MRGRELLYAVENLNPDYIEAADKKTKKRKNIWVKLVAAAACFCIIFSVAMPAMAASIPAFYDILYAVSPAAAQRFKPVQMSCVDNGIRMEVTAAYIYEDTAEIYISMQDLEGSRIDETIDLFDSYGIKSPFDYAGHCKLSDYDYNTRTATFLVAIEHWNEQNIVGDKLTFSVREFLSNKKTYEGIIDAVSLQDVDLTSETQKVWPRGIGGTGDFPESTNSNMTVLKSVGSICSPIDGVTLTGIGYVDGRLHVQVYYEDILKTDNHGSIALFNTKTEEMITCNGAVSFFDDDKKGSYEDYIFTGVDAAELGTYELYGDFVASPAAVEGEWTVTFPLENMTD